MKIAICGGGPVHMALPKDIEYIGVDHGIDTLLLQGIKPILGVGDFDSIKTTTSLDSLSIVRLPVRKDVTDTQHALEEAIKRGYQEIDVYGVTGGRMDHYMACICLLQKFKDIEMRLIDEQNCIYLLKAGVHKIYSNEYTYLSFFSFDATTISLSSCEYPLNHYYLTKEDPLCVSNQIQGEYALVETSNDILCIQSRDHSYIF